MEKLFRENKRSPLLKNHRKRLSVQWFNSFLTNRSQRNNAPEVIKNAITISGAKREIKKNRKLLEILKISFPIHFNFKNYSFIKVFHLRVLNTYVINQYKGSE